MHITDKSAPWVKVDGENTQPVQAIADGEIVAYRIANEYLTSTYEGNTLHYSNSFCLVKHQFTGSDESESFEFFSLYMHLAPVSVIEEAEAATIPSWMHEQITAKTKTKVNLRGEPSNGENNTRIAGDAVETLPQGTDIVFSLLENYERQLVNGRSHQMAKCKVGETKQGWFCVENNLIDVVKEHPITIEDPEAVVVLEKPIPVRAGDPIGYLGRYDAAKLGGLIETRYQLHFELLSHHDKQPTNEFLVDFFGEEHSKELAILKNDSDSDEYLDLKLPSFFYSALYNIINHVTKGEPTGREMFDRFRPWDSCKPVVVRNNSEWYKESRECEYLDKLISEHAHPRLVRQVEHEKQRIDSLVWHKKAKAIGLDKQVWNWWPLGKVKKRNWREPIDNPISTNHTYQGYLAPMGGLFGMTRQNKYGDPHPHRGLDIFAVVGTPVYASVRAEVMMTRYSESLGNTIVLKVDEQTARELWAERLPLEPRKLGTRVEHTVDERFDLKHGLRFLYCHLDSLEINPKTNEVYKVKDIIEQGCHFANVGVSGNASPTKAPHLHFEVLSQLGYGNVKTRVNPGYFVDFKYYDEQSSAEKEAQRRIAGQASQEFNITANNTFKDDNKRTEV
ncbi:M23 family metallopeptidase [Vibrio sp. WXL210]|uniref:M23 family metallopeptidase n=1 Tax=Vibrio sp. WXL210 TaxID=3450709 RepID=UPI003EC7E503